MNVQECLDAKFGYANQNYKSDSFNGKVERELIGDDIKDAFYTYKYFDILEWWKKFGNKQWPELASAAAILIGKPTHNGFQERVFSRGTYKDCKLKQRLNEHSFEMSVLNSINSGLLTTAKEAVLEESEIENVVATFFAKRNVQTNIILPRDVEESEVSKAMNEFNNEVLEDGTNEADENINEKNDDGTEVHKDDNDKYDSGVGTYSFDGEWDDSDYENL